QYRLAIHGSWGHGSMPRHDNAVVLVAEAIRRLVKPGPARATPLTIALLESVADALPVRRGARVRAILDPDPGRSDAALDESCDPFNARAVRALLRDTISPNIVTSGVKTNVIPGEAELYVDCR